MGKKENLKGLFSNSRTRIIILFTAAVVIFAVFYGLAGFVKSTSKGDLAGSSVSDVPVGIQTVPGSTKSTKEYKALVDKQNREQYKEALKSGKSVLPTIVEMKNFGDGVEQVGATDGTGGVGFSTLKIQGNSRNRSLWYQNLKSSNCSVSAIKEALQQGAVITDVKSVCDCAELRRAGFNLSELKLVCACKGLKAAGYSAAALKKEGFDAKRLYQCGYNACELKAAGFSAMDLKAAGLSDGELKGAGFSPEEIRAAGGLPDGVSAEDVRSAGCSADAIAGLRAQGVSASAIKRISGCSLAQLKAGGFSANELKAAGFSAAQLKNAGFSAEELAQAGFSPKDLLDAGFSPADLARAGFSPSAIADALSALPPGITPDMIEKAGCSKEALMRLKEVGVSAKAMQRYSKCSPKELSAAGYDVKGLSDQEKAAAMTLPDGVSLEDVKKAGCDPKKLASLRAKGVSATLIKKTNGCSAAALKAAGFSAASLHKAGFSDSELAAAGFSPAEIAAAKMGLPAGISIDDVKKAGCNPAALAKLKASGVKASTIKKLNGCSAAQLKAAGFSASDLKRAGFSDSELAAAGFSPAEIAAANSAIGSGPDGSQVSDAEIKKAGCGYTALQKLKNAGVSAERIRRISGCSLDALKAAGFGATALKKAGFSDAELRAAGFSPDEIAAANLGIPDGMSIADVKKAGCNVDAIKALRAKGVSAKAIKKLNGCSASVLKAAGFSAGDLKQAGFSDSDLAAAGFSPDEIAAAGLNLPEGVTADYIKKVGCDVSMLKKLREKGVSATAIRKLNGCSLDALKAAGFSAKDLKKAGFSNAALLGAGFSPDEVKAASLTLPDGVSMADIANAGCDPKKVAALRAKGVSAAVFKNVNKCSASQLKAAGFSAQSLHSAGFSDGELMRAGFSPDEIKAAKLGLPASVSLAELKKAGCSPQQLFILRQKGVSAKTIKEMNGCSAAQLKAAGFAAKDLLDAGFSPAALSDAGFSDKEISKAIGSPLAALANLKKAGCNVDAIRKARLAGVSAETVVKTQGCSLADLKAAGYSAAELKAAGFSAAELKDVGFSAAELKAAGFSAAELKDAGFSAADLKAAGFSAAQLKAAGFSAADLKGAGFSAADLKDAGFSASDLKAAGFSAKDLKAAGFDANQLKAAGFSAAQLKDAGFSAKALRDAGYSAADVLQAGFSPKELQDAGFTNAQIKSAATGSASSLAGLSGFSNQDGSSNSNATGPLSSEQQKLQALDNFDSSNQQTSREKALAETQAKIKAIQEQQKEQRLAIQNKNRLNQMVAQYSGAAGTLVSNWAKAPTQGNVGTIYMPGDESDQATAAEKAQAAAQAATAKAANQEAIIRAGDILFAVLDSGVNSDQPGPVLATVVSGDFKGTKLIGSFQLSKESGTVSITFNKMSVPGLPKTTSMSAYAVDPDTAHTALSSHTNRHILLRYGTLFASSFMTGFGNSFQSSGTTVTVGSDNAYTVEQNTANSALENAVIALADVGKAWGQASSQTFNMPPTVYVYSGTGIGVLFTSDLMSL